MSNLGTLIREELGGPVRNWRTVGARALSRMLPFYAAGRLRAAVFRAFGYQIGYGTVIFGTPTLFGDHMHKHLRVGANCVITIDTTLDLIAPITIGAGATLGPGVMIITGHHSIGPAYRRMGQLVPQPVVIEDGVWIGAGALILPGIRVGAGAIVGAGSVVTKDVPRSTIVAGSPAGIVRKLDDTEAARGQNGRSALGAEQPGRNQH